MMFGRCYRVAAAAAVLAVSGCGLLERESVYDQAVEERPLEVPPELDAPERDSSMAIPGSSAGGSAERAAPASSASMVLADGRDSAWRRVGVALERSGIPIERRDPDSWTYVVDYVDEEARERRPGIFKRWILRRKGPEDLSGDYSLRLFEDGSGTRLELTDERGRAAREKVAQKIIGALRDRLG